ncbi:peptidoglycan recognition protein [Streptomyces bathyalis]|uniref:Peptidoglycan recognition protein n=1 Tax=Streptomyces bathyalis TaxID=2710756 RepID=A0A7T1T8W8_9ACTN|nr:peptidoglycan recognition protein [Streptomyces bathyalis]QPP08538.1 peptidoglycan recognition protein [Streptomyces bathyalis]
MRALLVTSIGVACAGALLLPLAPTESAESMLNGKRSTSADDAAPPLAARGPGGVDSGTRAAGAEGDKSVPGSTQSVTLRASGGGTRAGDELLSAWEDDPSGGRRVASRKVKPFSLVGVVWKDPGAVPPGRIQVQTRSSATKKWSAWRTLNTHGDGSPSPGERSRRGEKALGATAPMWVGDSTAVRVRIVPDVEGGRPGDRSGAREARETTLPKGARLELIDPGKSGGAGRRAGDRAREEDPAKRPGGVLPALTRADTRSTYGDDAADATPSKKDRAEDTHIGPRPQIVTRKGWGADESLREQGFTYGRTTKAAFVHHSAETNDYNCGDVPAIIRGIYRYHVKSSHWRDLGYNFLVDKCGKIYEGRAGGVAKPVTGAHTLGFNTDTTGIAVLGTYTKAVPSKAAKDALAKLTAWKLGVHGVDASGKVTLTSEGGTKHKRGSKVTLNAVPGHRDGFTTECPGEKLYGELPAVRTEAGRLQGRR